MPSRRSIANPLSQSPRQTWSMFGYFHGLGISEYLINWRHGNKQRQKHRHRDDNSSFFSLTISWHVDLHLRTSTTCSTKPSNSKPRLLKTGKILSKGTAITTCCSQAKSAAWSLDRSPPQAGGKVLHTSDQSKESTRQVIKGHASKDRLWWNYGLRSW